MKLVLDASVLLAATQGRPDAHALLRLLRDQAFDAPASVPLLLDWEAALREAAPYGAAGGGQSLQAMHAFARALAALCQPVALSPLWRPRCREASGDLLLATAHAAGARSVVIARDASHLTRPAWRLGLVLLTPAQALQAVLAPPASPPASPPTPPVSMEQ